MKKLLVLLVFIPIISFGQFESDSNTSNSALYNGVMRISGEQQFKRFMIENDYELIEIDEENDRLSYAYRPTRLKKKEPTSSSWAYYSVEFNLFNITWHRRYKDGSFVEDNEYDELFDEVKKRCEFVEVFTFKSSKVDYSCYRCPDQSYNGLLGFTSTKIMGEIIHLDY